MRDHTNRPIANRRRFLQGTGSAAVALSLAGCAGDDPDEGADDSDDVVADDDDETETPEEEPDEIARGGFFRYGMSETPGSLNHLVEGDMYTWAILNLIYEPGTVVDPVNNEVKPWVYTDWKVEDPDADELDVYFDYRRGLTWSDGEEFDIEDVLFTYEYLLEERPGQVAAELAPIEFVEEADTDWDLHMRLNEPISVFAAMQLGEIYPLPKHVWEDVDDLTTFQPTEELDEVVGLGAGVVTRYEPDTTVEVTFRDPEEWGLGSLDWIEAHEEFRAGGPFLEGVRFNVFGSSTALHEALLQDDIDTIYDWPDPGVINNIEEEERLEFVDGSDSGYNHYSFNMRTEPLDCTAFRQVLNFAFDHIYWVDQLNRGVPVPGNFVIPPGYISGRPETEEDPDLINDHAAGEALHFREQQPGVVDVEGIREFLENGTVIDGSEGEYVGQEYPGSITEVETTDSEARHEYTFGEVETDMLEEAGADAEIRVDGQTIPELIGRPLEFLQNPPDDSPLESQMVDNFIGQLHQIGIPVDREVMTFGTMLDVVYREADFDIYHMGWTNQAPFGVQTLNNLFHSSEAHADPPGEEMVWNAMGYGTGDLPGADDLIDEARRTMDTDVRDAAVRQAAEKVYLDAPTMVTSNERPIWPVNTRDFGGFIDGLPDPGSSYQTAWQLRMAYQRE